MWPRSDPGANPGDGPEYGVDRELDIRVRGLDLDRTRGPSGGGTQDGDREMGDVDQGHCPQPVDDRVEEVPGDFHPLAGYQAVDRTSSDDRRVGLRGGDD